MKFKKILFNWLTNRYQLVIRNEENLAEKTTFNFSYPKLLCLCAVLLIILVACSLALSTTILARWLNPAYIVQENKKELAQLARSVDVLEQQTNQQKKFITLLQSIISGKEPPTYELPKDDKKKIEEKDTLYTSDQLVEAGTLLQSESEEERSASLDTYNKPINDLKSFFFCAPIQGIITKSVKQKNGHYSVDIVFKDQGSIKCVADGVVILASKTVEMGWVVVIQHNRNLISIYKHHANLLKKVGNFVKAGDIIATTGDVGKLSKDPHLQFELWYAGSSLNPEHFITF